MVLNGTMPASSHGLPTSSIRDDKPPHFSQRIFTASMYGRCGEFPSKTFQPSTALDFSSAWLPITVKCSHSTQTQMGKASPQKRFLEIIQSLMLCSQSSSRASPSGGIHLMVGTTRSMRSRQSMRMNHSSTGRKINSDLQRQQC